MADREALDLMLGDMAAHQANHVGETTPGRNQALAAQLRQLHLAGARNFGYYPDDFHQNVPEESIIKPAISVDASVSGR